MMLNTGYDFFYAIRRPLLDLLCPQWSLHLCQKHEVITIPMKRYLTTKCLVWSCDKINIWTKHAKTPKYVCSRLVAASVWMLVACRPTTLTLCEWCVHFPFLFTLTLCWLSLRQWLVNEYFWQATCCLRPCHRRTVWWTNGPHSPITSLIYLHNIWWG